ncbi:MAG TPA: HD domain-containing protein [Verrucomicrobiae bacterium]|nr:HD domain-containing protein [Verrucomicrobiae bacterium]
MRPPQSLDDVINLYRERGHRHYGESVSELEHALQCATFAQRANEAPVVVAACLLHDYGHLCHDLGETVADEGVDARHENFGASQLRHLFVDEVVEAGRLHVAAKRYLCWKEPGYYEGLSGASRKSLHLQGGRMSDAEAREFEREPHYEIAVRARRYDDMGKVPGMETPGLDSFVPLLKNFIR